MLLGLFAPRAFGSVTHEHDTPHASNAEHCAACTLGHTPVLASVTSIALDDPTAVVVCLLDSSNDGPGAEFSFAVPYACGPPA